MGLVQNWIGFPREWQEMKETQRVRKILLKSLTLKVSREMGCSSLVGCRTYSGNSDFQPPGKGQGNFRDFGQRPYTDEVLILSKD